MFHGLTPGVVFLGWYGSDFFARRRRADDG